MTEKEYKQISVRLPMETFKRLERQLGYHGFTTYEYLRCCCEVFDAVHFIPPAPGWKRKPHTATWKFYARQVPPGWQPVQAPPDKGPHTFAPIGSDQGQP